MFSKIQRVCGNVLNNEPWGISIRPFLKFSASSLACGSLANRMWITANQLVEDPHAREQVFRAGQRLFALMAEQKDTAVDSFAMVNRVGAMALGLISTALAIKAITIVWNRKDRS